LNSYLYLWHIDSAYSRAIKWLLLSLDVPHQNRVLQWHELQTDPVLARANPKRQVPALQLGDTSIFDSLFMAMHFLDTSWTKTLDAALFRLADSDMAEAMRGFYRVYRFRTQPELKDTLVLHTLRDEAWQAWSRCMRWSDELLQPEHYDQMGVGAVLLHSIIACTLFFEEQAKASLPERLFALMTQVESNEHFKKMASSANGQQRVPFYYVTH
jgi:glutathione S-transferase